ncbi:sulfide/dihydroorotate dehydrogenase-like FAD/NAD-binding protein [Inediibacterium massiliense]|uniref:sulfide/dihydroorotate dehydrogenase-like FAD/NAD-binding protein n=1 Tax=Inediibacterium massiliense TaxID=1658111 RepID=UPI000AC2766F|nr:sulfide/dihydroorotate dehydrogenase-like FAD/NAD-binding protein [Inediibacterium massiliense]
MSDKDHICVDMGSEYCPCYLAEMKECIMCNHLQGKELCDCNWQGICIYQEFYWNGQKRKDIRKTVEGKIIEKKVIKDEYILFKVKVDVELALKLKHPGSYIFIRHIEKPYFFDTPMSIMDVDEKNGEIQFVVQILGPKTKDILSCEEKILVRGPYWNGVIGMKKLKETKEKKVLFIGKGVGLAPSILAIKHLLKNKNHITFVMDPGKIGVDFIKEYMKEFKIDPIEISLRNQKGVDLLTSLLKENYDLIYSSGSDKLHNIVKDEIEDTSKLVFTNNSSMCCGEGICGACTCKTKSGQLVRMCKMQVKAEEILEEGK